MNISPIGFGAFKIGRNTKIKYAMPYELPSDEECSKLLNAVLDMGVNLIDTAPAYGISEERIGKLLGHRRSEFLVCTKAGEEFDGVESRYDLSYEGIISSAHRSIKRLGGRPLDFLLLHTNVASEKAGLEEAVNALHSLRERGDVRFIGASPVLEETVVECAAWADVLMIELNLDRPPASSILDAFSQSDKIVFVKKALGSGKQPADAALKFVFSFPFITSVIIGSLNVGHMRANCELASTLRPHRSR